MKKARAIFLFVLLVLISPAHAQDSSDDYQSYIAYIAAANASLQLHQTAEAKRWIDRCPSVLRDWEWNYIYRRSNASIRHFRSGRDLPLSLDFNYDGSLMIVPTQREGLYLYETSSWKEQSVVKPAPLLSEARFQPGTNAIAFATQDGRLGLRQNGASENQWLTAPLGQGSGRLAFSPDGKAIAFATWIREENKVKGMLHLFDANSGTEIWKQTFGPQVVNDLLFNPEGNLLAAAGQNGRIIVWSLNEEKQICNWTLGTENEHPEVRALAFSPAGNFLVAGGEDGSVKCWHMGTGKVQQTNKPFDDPISALAFSHIGDQLLIGSEKGVIKAYDINSKRHIGTFFGHEKAVREIVFHPAQPLYATASEDGEIRVWEWSFEPPFSNKKGRTSHNYAFDLSPDGRWIATAGPNLSICLWRADGGKLEKCLTGPAGPLVNTVAFGPDSSRLAVANWGESVYLYDPFQEKLIRELKGLEGRCVDLAFSPDNRFIAAASADSSLVLWNAADGQMIKRLSFEAGITELTFSHTGEQLAAGTNTGTIVFHSCSDWDELQRIKAHDGPILHLSFGPRDKKILSTGTDKAARLWMVKDGTRRKELLGHRQKVWSGAWSPDGDRIATGSSDKSVRIWDTLTGETVLILRDGFTNRINNLAFSPKGDQLYINVTGEQIRVLDGSER